MKYIVYIGQINQVGLEVSAESREEAKEKAGRKWKREWADPVVVAVEKATD